MEDTALRITNRIKTRHRHKKDRAAQYCQIEIIGPVTTLSVAAKFFFSFGYVWRSWALGISARW